MHGEISLGVRHENEGQQETVDYRFEQLHKFQVQAEKPHPRDRDFVQCSDVPG